MTTGSDEKVSTKFVAAWSVFAQTCGQFWAPEASFQAWFAHYLISQFGIDRVAREPITHINPFSDSLFKARMGKTGEVRLDVVITRSPGIKMPHYANQRGKASDLTGLGLLKELAVISELKVGASTQNGFTGESLIRDVDKLSLLLTEFRLMHPDHEPPLAYLCVLDNHGSKTFDPAELEEYCLAAGTGVKLLLHKSDSRPEVSPDGFIYR